MTEKQRSREPRKSLLYAGVGVVLGLGAPLGSLLLRLFFYHLPLADELSTFGFFYLYMGVGTAFFFGLFGFLLGGREDLAEERLNRQEATLKELSGQLHKLTNGLEIRCKDCEIVRGMERQVLQADKLATIGRFAASVAHEVNNPLMGIKNAITFITEREVDGQKKREYAQLVKEGFQRIEETIQTLLHFAKQQEMAREPLHLTDPLVKALSFCEGQLKQKQILVERDFQSKAKVYGDAKLLQQALLNLLLNAYDALSSGGLLTLRTFEDDGFVFCQVQDTGRGIPQGELISIFEPFYTTKAKGTGLGLSVCRSIVEKHGGSISVESAEGVGTTFTLKFPRWHES